MIQIIRQSKNFLRIKYDSYINIMFFYDLCHVNLKNSTCDIMLISKLNKDKILESKSYKSLNNSISTILFTDDIEEYFHYLRDTTCKSSDYVYSKEAMHKAQLGLRKIKIKNLE